MRALHFFNLIMMSATAFFAWEAVADAKPMGTSAMKVSVMQNLSPAESSDVKQALSRLGYETTNKPLFSDSKDAVIVTKALENDREPASITIELVQMDEKSAMPRTLFQYQVEGNDVHAMMNAFPKANSFLDASSPLRNAVPVAQNDVTPFP